MRLPELSWLTLEESVGRVVDRCQVSREVAEHRLERAFRDRELAIDFRGRRLGIAFNRQIDWDISAITLPPASEGGAGLSIIGVRTSAASLDDWISNQGNCPRAAPTGTMRDFEPGGRETVKRAILDVRTEVATLDDRKLGPEDRPGAAQRQKARGPTPAVRLKVMQLMWADLQSGKFCLPDLMREKELSLSLRYDCSRDTARKARNMIESEFSDVQ
jgi:hypothetical protein